MIKNLPVKSVVHKDLTVEGYSRAAVQTYWRVPELKLGFDFGAQPWSFMGTPTWFVSHAHMDHLIALPVYVARRRMMKMTPPVIYMPESTIEPMQRILRLFSRVDRGRLPCELLAARAGDEIELSREHVVTVCRALRDDQDLRFELGLGVSGVHYPADAGRELHAVYHLCSVTHGRRLRLEVAVPDADPHIPSSTPVYPGHDWHERETYDFFGIVFDGHPGLARIEMPDDWPGHPQRKDYPLGGIPVEYKGAHIPPPDQRRAYN